jgi:hypothetical protein
MHLHKQLAINFLVCEAHSIYKVVKGERIEHVHSIVDIEGLPCTQKGAKALHENASLLLISRFCYTLGEVVREEFQGWPDRVRSRLPDLKILHRILDRLR